MKKRSGLTLVELLAALAIVGVLMTAGLRVTSRLAREQTFLQRSRVDSSVEPRLKELLARDLAHARRYRSRRDGLGLMTQSSLDAKTLAFEHLPATVRYEVREIGAKSWLLRIQELPRGGTFTEAVCTGVRKIELASAGSDKTQPPDEWKAMPAVVTVTVDFDGPGREPILLSLNTKWNP